MDAEPTLNTNYLKCSADHCYSKRMMVCLKPSCISKCLICPMCAQYEHNGPLHLVQHLDEFKEDTLKILSCNSENSKTQFLEALKTTKVTILERIKQLQNIMSCFTTKLKYAVKNQFETFIQSFNIETSKKEYKNFSENLSDVKVINAVYRVQVLKRNEFEGKAQCVKATEEKYLNIFDKFLVDFLKSTYLFQKLQYVADLRFSENVLSHKIAELKIFEKLEEQNKQPQETKIKIDQKVQKIRTKKNKKNTITVDSSPESRESNSPRSRQKRRQEKKDFVSSPIVEESKHNGPRRKVGDSIRAESTELPSWNKVSYQVKTLSTQQNIAENFHIQSQKSYKKGPEITAQLILKQSGKIGQNQKQPSSLVDKPTVIIQYHNKADLKKMKNQKPSSTQRKQQKTISTPPTSATSSPPFQNTNEKSYFPMKTKTTTENTNKINQKPNIQSQTLPQQKINEQKINDQSVKTPIKEPGQNNVQPEKKLRLQSIPKVNTQSNKPLKEKVEQKKKVPEAPKVAPTVPVSSVTNERPTDPRPPKNSSKSQVSNVPLPPRPQSCYRFNNVFRPFQKPTSMTEEELKAWFKKAYKNQPVESQVLCHRHLNRKMQYLYYYGGEFKWQTEQVLHSFDEDSKIKQYWQAHWKLYK